MSSAECWPCPVCHALRPPWAFEPQGGACAECRGRVYTLAEVMLILAREPSRPSVVSDPDTRPREEG